MSEGGRTALVVVTGEAEQILLGWRRRHLAATVAHGIPAHVTILFPFVPAGELDSDALATLRELYAAVPAFVATLTSVESFPGYAWLRPEPGDRFRELIDLTTAAFPAYPPYGDLGLEPIPHCTVGAADEPGRLAEIVDEVRDGLAGELPIRCSVEEVSLLEERAELTWFVRDVFALRAAA